MSALVNALDNHTPLQIGENGHVEYTWSNSITERIVQLNFQLTRVNNKHFEKIVEVYESLIVDVQQKYSGNEFIQYMSILYRLIAYTRDIIDGKGEYMLSFVLLDVWSKYYPELAKFAIHEFLISSTGGHQLGCWKDVKYFWHCFQNNNVVNDYTIKLVNEQLRKDVSSESTPSLAAKWVPREKSAFSGLYNTLAFDYFKSYLNSAPNEEKLKQARRKALMDYRKLISGLNRRLDTVQVKQCSGSWSEIDPHKQTSITMLKQKKAFLNIKKDGSERHPDSSDRVKCAENFTKYIDSIAKGEVEAKGKRVGLNDFTKSAFSLSERSSTDPEVILLNSQWENNASQTGALGQMIAMVDTSGSMEGDPLDAAIALGIRVAEKSKLGKRVLTFSATPEWINLDGVNGFVNMANRVRKANWGMNTNFYAALDLILDAIIQSKLSANEAEEMVLAIFSDMQIDAAFRDSSGLPRDKYFDTMYTTIEKKYAEAGMRVCGQPYKPPHILFWNLRSGSGSPVLSTKKNVSMMSGFSPALLNMFCDQGFSALSSYTPWSILVSSLDNERYKSFDTKLKEIQQ